jgi:hypothetical protein
MFIQPVIIHNTFKNRSILENLQYTPSKENLEKDIFIVTSDSKYYSYTNKYFPIYNGTIDLRYNDNEELFKAIAALRDDSDYMQWFVNVSSKKLNIKTWFLCNEKDRITFARKQEYFSNTYVLAHKATVDELVEHFKK